MKGLLIVRSKGVKSPYGTFAGEMSMMLTDWYHDEGNIMAMRLNRSDEFEFEFERGFECECECDSISGLTLLTLTLKSFDPITPQSSNPETLKPWKPFSNTTHRPVIAPDVDGHEYPGVPPPDSILINGLGHKDSCFMDGLNASEWVSSNQKCERVTRRFESENQESKFKSNNWRWIKIRIK